MKDSYQNPSKINAPKDTTQMTMNDISQFLRNSNTTTQLKTGYSVPVDPSMAVIITLTYATNMINQDQMPISRCSYLILLPKWNTQSTGRAIKDFPKNLLYNFIDPMLKPIKRFPKLR